MIKSGQFDPEERRREKQHSREQDDAALREGRVSGSDLQARNSVFSGLNLAASSVRRPGRVAA
jgi:hypothetical protein